MNPATIHVEVAYARPDCAFIRPLRLAQGSTIADAVRASGLLQDCPEIDLSCNKTGIFGRLAGLDVPLAHGDRVEIYRGLSADPKAARRRRAKLAAKRA